MITTLIADAGGTSTDWALIHEGEILQLESTSGINPVIMSDDEIATVLDAVEVRFSNPGDEVFKVLFYGAGCRDEITCGRVENALHNRFPHASITVDSDLVGAAVALYGNSHGIACILGTGANAGYYSIGSIAYKPASLGYILGDEGSGASMGKRFLNAYYSGKFSEETMRAVNSSSWGKELANLGEIINRIYRCPGANTYLASFTRLLKELIHLPEIRDIVIQEFTSFRDGMLRQIMDFENEKGLQPARLGFVGSVATHFSAELQEVVGKCEIIQSPLLAIAETIPKEK